MNLKRINILFLYFGLSMLTFFSSLSAFEVENIPVQSEGRVKPLDTFARNLLLRFYGKREIKDQKINATDWLLDLILYPQEGRQRKIFNIRNPEVVSSLFLDWYTDHKYSYNEIIDGLSSQVDLINTIEQKDNSIRTPFDKQLLELSENALIFEKLSYMKNIKLIPPALLDENAVWQSPFDFIISGVTPSYHQEEILNSLQQYLAARFQNNDSEIKHALSNYENVLSGLSFNSVNVEKLKDETWMNSANLFVKSLAFYILSFLIIGLSWMVKPVLFRKISYLFLIIGFFIHGYGILLRMQIMGRPPVSTLYESVIFVSFILLLLAVLLEYFRKDGLGIFVGSVGGSILHFIGFSYASDGDTLGMLVAVLDSNFWLATHVTTITIGYGASLVAGFVGHLYLVQNILDPVNSKKLKSIFNNLFGITLVALFFTLFGTILGGIWADQSWGRFWGWDPKENGALLIVLWQLLMIHSRLSGIARPPLFALGMALNNIIVALAWFGVNLLQVGLHSYGFDDGVARNLYLFISFEILFCLGLYFFPRLKSRFQTI
ncbi:MAG: hypothetical protein CMG55_07945 [Candidatus Marinimicrobia bacterium]|nr:hypothetical protein [Candidatus Neomarinimicrobiota bacterium]|tara:strand:- start:608 stop:2251 length:1644 start_codon:yes stop_codon:yes gene_type:complete